MYHIQVSVSGNLKGLTGYRHLAHHTYSVNTTLCLSRILACDVYLIQRTYAHGARIFCDQHLLKMDPSTSASFTTYSVYCHIPLREEFLGKNQCIGL